MFALALLLLAPPVMERIDDTPPLDDLYRYGFPCKAVARQGWLLSMEFRDFALYQHSLYPGGCDWWAGVIQAQVWHVDVWDALDDAWLSGFPESRRRYGLVKLKELIGEEAYYQGRMPAVCPWYLYHEILR